MSSVNYPSAIANAVADSSANDLVETVPDSSANVKVLSAVGLVIANTVSWSSAEEPSKVIQPLNIKGKKR